MNNCWIRWAVQSFADGFVYIFHSLHPRSWRSFCHDMISGKICQLGGSTLLQIRTWQPSQSHSLFHLALSLNNYGVGIFYWLNLKD